MIRGRSRPSGWIVSTLLLVGLIVVAPAMAQDVSFEETGDAVPGGAVQVTVTADGANAYNWTQIGGVPANLSNTNSATVGVTLGSRDDFKEELFVVMAEPPEFDPEDFPGVEFPEGNEFSGGLRDRFEVLGVNPYQLEEAGAVELQVEITTATGTITETYTVHTVMPWYWTSNIRNVGLGRTVLLNGKEQESYNWQLITVPGGSSAALAEGGTRHPEFTPDVKGLYEVQVTDDSDMSVITLDIYADVWYGAITGEDENGRPEMASCTACHADTVNSWKETGHAEIFKDMLNTNTHWGPGCFECHSVGFDPLNDNNGIDDQDDYADFLENGGINEENPDAYANALVDFPNTTRFANIQCENCHGPQGENVFGSPQHTNGDNGVRYDLASDTCAVCHGEPPRHGRHQQWQLSAHSNYELAIDEGESGSCSRCHTVNGFLAWLPSLLDGQADESVEVTWTAAQTHPQTCVTCHDPHNIGTQSGDDTDAIIRIQGDTPPLIAGFTATDVGRGAMCMTCHNTRRGLRNDAQPWPPSDPDRAPHPGAQTDVLMGQNAYFVTTGVRGGHGNRDESGVLEDTCVNCHMEATPPPGDLSYNQGGSNHTFYARADICSECHGFENGDFIQGPVMANLMMLEEALLDYYNELVEEQIGAGNAIDVDGDILIEDFGAIEELHLAETRGRQGLEFVVGGESYTATLGNINVGDQPMTAVASEQAIKAGWNFWLIEADGSYGVHNPPFVTDVVENALGALAGDMPECSESATSICLNGGRFQVSVNWSSADQGGDAAVSNLRTDDSGIFYFNNPNNLEFLIKVLDGCSLNQNYWVFFAATTDVQFTVTVTDTQEGVTKTYENALGSPADAITDTSAFATCP